MKLCVFQGTFNPIHNAHLKMAEYAFKHFDFDKILFIPAARPPHKNFDSDFSHHRFNLVKIATDYNNNFQVSDIEFKLNGKSYTYNTILQLYKMFDIEGKINFIIGTDAFEKIESWYEADKLKNLIDFIVFVRENNLENHKFDELQSKGYTFKLANMDFLDISSTQIRSMIKNNEDVSQFITEEEREYIEKYGLYKN